MNKCSLGTLFSQFLRVVFITYTFKTVSRYSFLRLCIFLHLRLGRCFYASEGNGKSFQEAKI